MKPSHLRTPRSLSECYFVEGYYTIEPAQWQQRWNSDSPILEVKSSSIFKIVAVVALISATVIALFI
jgi:hypothetical protein